MMFDYSGQVVLISGASGHLGRAVVNAFNLYGAQVVACDHHSGLSASSFPGLKDPQKFYLANHIDVTEPQSIIPLINEISARFGRIDVLVNTVGGFRGGTSVHQTSIETWDFLMNINARSVFVTSSAVLPIMLQQKKGKIINICSHSAIMAGGGDGVYSAAKSAVARLTESMSAEYKNMGIQVNAILPSTLKSVEELKKNPGSGVSVEAVADLILHLSSKGFDIVSGALIPAYGLRF